MATQYVLVLTNKGEVEVPITTGADSYFRYVQSTAASIWNVAHNLGKRTSVTVVDSAGDEVEGDVHYVDDNNVTLTFSAAFSGEAYFN